MDEEDCTQLYHTQHSGPRAPQAGKGKSSPQQQQPTVQFSAAQYAASLVAKAEQQQQQSPTLLSSSPPRHLRLLLAIARSVDLHASALSCAMDWPGDGDFFDQDDSDYTRSAHGVSTVSTPYYHSHHSHHTAPPAAMDRTARWRNEVHAPPPPAAARAAISCNIIFFFLSAPIPSPSPSSVPWKYSSAKGLLWVCPTAAPHHQCSHPYVPTGPNAATPAAASTGCCPAACHITTTGDCATASTNARRWGQQQRRDSTSLWGPATATSVVRYQRESAHADARG